MKPSSNSHVWKSATLGFISGFVLSGTLIVVLLLVFPYRISYFEGYPQGGVRAFLTFIIGTFISGILGSIIWILRTNTIESLRN